MQVLSIFLACFNVPTLCGNYWHDTISSEVLTFNFSFFFFFFLKKGKLFSSIHLVSALLALCFCLQNNMLSLYPEAFAIWICCLLHYMLNVGENKSVW